MKSKMWNKIFKNKSSKSSSPSVTTTETNDLLDDNNLFEDPQQVMIASSSTSSSSGVNNNSIGHSTKSSSKLSKMVNSFTLKRNTNKENGNNNGYNSDVALSIIRNAELNNEISKFNNYNKNNSNLNKNVKNMKRHKSIDNNGNDGGGCNDDFMPIMDTTSKLIKTTPPDEIPLSPKTDFNDPNFPISPEPPEQIELQTCPICTRKFIPDTLIKHIGICERMATKKRKKFDSFRQRREGTDLADYLPKNFGIPTSTSVNQPAKQQIETKILSPKIQVQESTPVSAHKQFNTDSQSLQQNSQKKATLNPISPTSKPIRSKNVAKRLAPPSEECPHCARSFGIKAFDRHVDWCKEKSRLQAVKNNADLKTAKDRLEARTKYRAPNLKAKRETIRNKYSGNGDDGHSIDDNRSVDNNILSMSNSLSSSFMSDGPDEKQTLSSRELLIKSQKINTKGITLEAEPKKKTSIDNKINKKQISKIIKKSSTIKKIDGNKEDASTAKKELNLIGLPQNFANENKSLEISNDGVNFSNNKNLCQISECGKQDVTTVDRIEIEEIIPLNSKNHFNFDDTPIRPAKKIFIEKNINNGDETLILPSKIIYNHEPSLVLTSISDNKHPNSIDDVATCPPISLIEEEVLGGFIQNLGEDGMINEEKPSNNFDEMPIRPTKTKFTDLPVLISPKVPNKTTDYSENDLSHCPPKSTFKDNLPNESIEIILESEEVGPQYSQQILPKDNFDDIPIKPVQKISNYKFYSTTNSEDLDRDFKNPSSKSILEDRPLNEVVKSSTKSTESIIEDKIKVNCDEKNNFNKIGKTKTEKHTTVIAMRPSNTKLNNRLKDGITEINNRTKHIGSLALNNGTSLHSPKVILKDINVNHIAETGTSNLRLRNTSSIQPRSPENNEPAKNSEEFSTRPLKTSINTLKVRIGQTNLRAGYIDKIPLNLPNISNPISKKSENVTPIQLPKIILKDHPSSFLDEIDIRTSKPILRNRPTKSANDIPSKLSKDILKPKYANNFNEISNRSSKKNLNNISCPLPIISNKIIDESEPKRKLSLKTILPPINRPSLASISSDDFDKLLCSSDQINGRKDSQTSFKFVKKTKKDDHKISLPKLSQNKIKDLLSNGSENFWMQISNDTIAGPKIEQQMLTKQNLCEKSLNKKSGFSDKYDPFLSAKRQLEELCSPTAEAESPFSKTQHHQATSTPITIKTKPISSLSTSYTAPSPNPRNTLNTVKSNFRRTSSLRSPRKNNPCPRPLFVPPSRCLRPTTIQRGISDEGPISTNFIRPEEYDEMPVKSACINNFATAINSPQFSRRDSSPQKLLSRSTSRESSPLVIKRDPNSNLNRRNLRLNLGNNKELNPSNNIPLLKTDSLAVFLKYETELTKNPSEKLISALNQLGNTPPIVLPQQNSSSTTQPVSNLISEKDWKDKSNTLSKQNSLKNSSSDLVEKTFGNVEKEKLTLLKNSLTNLLDSGNNNNKLTDIPKKLPPTISSPPDVSTPMPSINKTLPIKLEPLHQKVYIATPPPSKTQSPPVMIPSLAPLFPQIKSTPMTVAINNNLINLNSILTIDSKEMDNNFIDPKLINICDNLQVSTTSNTTIKQSDDSDLTSVGSQDSAYRPKTAPKLSTDESQSSGHQSSESVIEKSPSPPTTTLQRKEQYHRQTSSNRNSSDKKNLLKRQIRLGKNQFLYDASPSDSEPSPDPIINKSEDDLLTSVTSTTTHLPLVESSDKQFDSLLSPSNNPIFNNFDFEEFLSSFEASNDDDEDQFPGFKDCKEFLMNRCLNMRSMNNNFFNNDSNFFNNTQNSIRSRKIELDPMMMLNDSSTNNNNRRQTSHDDDDDVQIVHDKREIFISIETDQNDNETSNPCPNDPSIKNPKIEEINSNDNKFTRIETYHLPIFEEKDETLTTDFTNDVTIRRNNVKNKQQHDDIKENITCDSVTSMYPVDSDERSSVECYPIGRRSGKSKTSGDSAYGSLSRQSPTLTDRSSIRRNSASRNNHRLPTEQNPPSSDANMMIQSNESKRRNRELSASSSGSDNSLPPINSHHIHHQHQKVLNSYQEESNLQNSKDTFSTMSMDFGSLPSPGGVQQNQQQQMSKFCHECGSRFLVTQAKFCMECGVKRMMILK